MNTNLDQLHPYPFEKLNQLFKDIEPPQDLPCISLSIGEPKHQVAYFVKQALIDNLELLSNYPSNKGLPTLRQSIANWPEQRFHLNKICSEHQILPVSGMREGFFVQAMVN